jgi:hypothetical protein
MKSAAIGARFVWHDARDGDGGRYERHRPEETVLYRVVREHWDTLSIRTRIPHVHPIQHERMRMHVQP